MGFEHRAEPGAYCDNPVCMSCNAWLRFEQENREQRRRNYKCRICGNLPPEDFSLCWALHGANVCERCYERWKDASLKEVQTRKNELYRAMLICEQLGGCSPEQTNMIGALGKRDRELTVVIKLLGGVGHDVGQVI